MTAGVVYPTRCPGDDFTIVDVAERRYSGGAPWRLVLLGNDRPIGRTTPPWFYATRPHPSGV